jgi:hypothetical protein
MMDESENKVTELHLFECHSIKFFIQKQDFQKIRYVMTSVATIRNPNAVIKCKTQITSNVRVRHLNN